MSPHRFSLPSPLIFRTPFTVLNQYEHPHFVSWFFFFNGNSEIKTKNQENTKPFPASRHWLSLINLHIFRLQILPLFLLRYLSQSSAIHKTEVHLRSGSLLFIFFSITIDFFFFYFFPLTFFLLGFLLHLLSDSLLPLIPYLLPSNQLVSLWFLILMLC